MKNKNKYKFNIPNRKQPVWKIVKPILKTFTCNKFEVINLAGDMPNKCIIVGNHEGKLGPVAYDNYLPCFHVKWGAYFMLGSYKERYNYLRNVFYIKKLGKSKFVAIIKAGFESLFSHFFYRGLKILPSFPDARVVKTLKYSADVLDDDKAVMVYPEDSNEGYFEEPIKFHNGFVMLADHYYKKRGEDLPVYPVYLSLKNKKLIIGKPLYVNEFRKQGFSTEDIAEKFRLEVIGLYRAYVKIDNKQTQP